MTPIFANQFIGKAKKLRDKDRQALNEAVHDVLDNPAVGKAKKGDLAGVLAHKFKLNRQTMVLAYAVSGQEVHLLDFGAHENFYRISA